MSITLHGTNGVTYNDGTQQSSHYGDAGVDAHLSGGTGISYAAGVITNTAPDQTVSLTSGSNVTITGTYPSFTIASSAGSAYGDADVDAHLSGGTGISYAAGVITNSAPDQTVSLTSGSNVTITGTYPSFTIASSGTAYSAGTGVTLVGTTFNIGQAVATSSNAQFNSLGIGTSGSGTAGEIRATNNIIAYYSDKRLKENIKRIDNALDKVQLISGVTFNANDEAAKYGYTDKKTQVGVIAQEIEQVLPEIVVAAPFDIAINDDGTEYSKSGENYKTVQYEKIVPLLIEAIKELKQEIDILKDK